MDRSKLAVIFLLVFVVLAGCSGLETFSNVARPGDTISVALKGAEGLDYIDKNDITVRVHDAQDNYHTVWLETLVRVYADPLSEAALSHITFPVGAKYEGQWMALVTLSEPLPQGGTVPAIAPGPATLELTHPTLSLDDPSLTIIAGNGSRHLRAATDPNFGMLMDRKLSASPYVGVVNDGVTSEIVAGGTFVFLFDSTKFPASDRPLRAVKLSQDPNIQMLSSVTDLPGDIDELKVILLNPNGFNAAKGAITDFTQNGKSLLRDLSFVLTWGLPSTAASYSPLMDVDLVLDSVEFIDVNGQPVADLQASFSGGYGYQ